MALGVLLTVWVWSMAVGASEWGSLYFEVLLRPDDGGSVACQPLKRGKNTHTKKSKEWVWHKCINVILYSITELHLSKLSAIITQVFYLFSLVKRWCVFHKLKYWNHCVYQSVALDAGLFPLFWMACADCMPIQIAAIWRGEEMKQLELRSS